ncbi:MAG: hypothetical protein DRI79_01300 [Chloroflexi bacterium]|nr:MAG: hypothetical protein DRI80_18365 [Chloroflexota bacterium]RLC92133.1 MAG: hypothetical protein DRI79_01300 [Chloroflexota bacterium]
MSLSPFDHSELVLLGARALEWVWDGDGIRPPKQEREIHIETLADILQTNLSNGRWRHAARVDGAARPNSPELQRYAVRVATHYWAERERMARLAARDWDLWEELHGQLLKSAYHVLRDHFGLSHPVAYERANDYAQESCELIFRGRYPFDVPFHAWATRVLLNCIHAGEGRSTDLLDRGTFVEPAPADAQEFELIDEMCWFESEQSLWRWEVREVLWDAIQQLASPAQQQVIIQDFWYGQSSTEIAQELGKTPQAVYNLRHQALASLKAILEPQRYLFAP